MKLQLDLDNKVISLEERVNLLELYNTLERLFPQGEWKEFNIEAGITVSIKSDPQPYIPYIPIFPSPTTTPYPWWANPVITCDSVSYSLGQGTYKIEG